MSPVVIDTNVLLVANGGHADTSTQCRMACVARLLAHQKYDVVVFDDAYRILGEYQSKIRPNQPEEVGDAFLKWLLQNCATATRVIRSRSTRPDPTSSRNFRTMACRSHSMPRIASSRPLPCREHSVTPLQRKRRQIPILDGWDFLKAKISPRNLASPPPRCPD